MVHCTPYTLIKVQCMYDDIHVECGDCDIIEVIISTGT